MTALLTYHLKRPCGNIRPFCRPCANSFVISTCGKSHCLAQPPSSICLQVPGGYVPAPNWDCCVPELVDGVPMIPRFVTFTIPAAGQTLGVPLSDPAGVTDCCTKAAGTYQLEWNGTDAWEYWFVREPISEAAAVAASCGAPGFPPCIPPVDRRLLYKWSIKCFTGFGHLIIQLHTCSNCEAVSGLCEEIYDMFPAIIEGHNSQPGPPTGLAPPCFVQTDTEDGGQFRGFGGFSECDITPFPPVIIVRPVP